MSVTNRQVANAVGLVIAGAMRDVDNGTGLSSMDVYCAVARELSDWLEGETDLAEVIARQYFVPFVEARDEEN